MAKRKRLSPAAIDAETDSVQGAPEVKSMPRYPLGVALAATSARPPIAQVAGEAASQAALDEVASELNSARKEGRLVQALPLEAIQADHLIRDRLSLDEAEMEALKASLKARGQQTPIEVVALPEGRYGLISGWRRLSALSALHADTGEAQFATVQALIKPIETVSDSYVAMVEENEVRANLSFYERARLAAEAAKLGVYPTGQRAVQALFASASSSKRSKIITFLSVHAALDGALRFPSAIPERFGLTLAAALDADTGLKRKMREALRSADPQTAADERSLLERILSGKAKAGRPPKAQRGREVRPGVRLETGKGRLVLSGAGVTEDLQKALESWLAER